MTDRFDLPDTTVGSHHIDPRATDVDRLNQVSETVERIRESQQDKELGELAAAVAELTNTVAELQAQLSEVPAQIADLAIKVNMLTR